LKSRLVLVFAAAGCVAACAEGSDPGNASADAQVFQLADASPGSPDAPIFSTPDARVGTPDAAIGPPDAMVQTPDASGCTTQTIQLLSNENFDLGSGGGWVENGAGYPIVLSPSDPTYPLPITPQSGNYAAWMGGVDSATRAIYQDVVVPADATNLTLSGYIYIATGETSGVWDTWAATIRNTSGGVLETLASLSNADANDTWTAFSYPAATNLAGQTIRIYFENTNDAINNTNFFVDTLLLNVTSCQ